MKKVLILFVLLTVMTAGVFTAAAYEEMPTMPVRHTGYAEGVYIGSGEGRGSMIQLEVTVALGKISGIRVLRQGETPEVWQRAITMFGRLLGLSSDEAVRQVDAVSSATFSSEGIRKAVLDATRQAQPETDCPSAHFTDVNQQLWYHEGIDYAVKKGLMKGMSDAQFSPEAPMTRAMLVTVLWRNMGSPKAEPSSFSDVPADLWYTEAVAWAAEHGIVKGVDETTFQPDGNLTREQTAAILYRLARQSWIDTSGQSDLNSFADADSVSDYAAEAMQWCVYEGILYGSEGHLLPHDSATRAQAATLLTRFFKAFLIR
ncbi:MAG: S-layer homology domain-containing protein [Firmicutes bacterium]|nr:S-layer homology domain-containing protein [Bacillota bacterium]